MRRKIRLTESQLNRAIKESIKRALSGSGHVSCDGNSMVGGEYNRCCDTTYITTNKR